MFTENGSNTEMMPISKITINEGNPLPFLDGNKEYGLQKDRNNKNNEVDHGEGDGDDGDSEEDDDIIEEEEENGDKFRGGEELDGKEMNLDGYYSEDENEKKDEKDPHPQKLHDDDGDGDNVAEGEDVDESELHETSDDYLPEVVAAKKFFMSRLVQDLSGYSSPTDIPNEWKIKLDTSSRGLLKGVYEVWYINKNRKKFKTRIGVKMSLEVLPYCRIVKTMPRYLLAALANETREIFLLSYLIFSHPLPHLIREFSYPLTSDEMKMKCLMNSCSDELIDYSPVSYFSCGNTIVLNWGHVISNGHFHSRYEIYPLGFKSIRQEYDEHLHCLVDCLCEIDYYSLTSPSKRYTTSELDLLTPEVRNDIRPLFRITVAWELNERIVNKVYEGKSPQFVWKLILTERLGLPGGLPFETHHDDLNNLNIEKDDYVSQDDEERMLRNQLIDLRKRYLNSLSKNPRSEPISPRFRLVSTDYFNDQCIQRIVEGMNGVVDCSSYEYFGSRPSHNVKNALERSFIQLNSKMKLLDQASHRKHRQYLSKVEETIQRRDEVDSLAGNETITNSSQPPVITGKKRSREEQKQDKIRRMNLALKRKSRMRDIERVLKVVRDEEIRAIIIRKHTARIVIEQIAQDDEEKLMHSSSSESAPAVVPASAGASSAASSNGINSHSHSHHPSHEIDCYPLGKPLHLAGDTFGYCLELWVFLFTYSKQLGIATIPSQEIFEKLFSSLQSSFKHVKSFALEVTQLTGSSMRLEDFSFASKSSHLINKIGIALTRPLLEEYYKIMGMDVILQSSNTSFHIPLNEIIWKEISRVVLIYTLCKSYNMSDYEGATCLKGKGYSVTGGDIHEKRIMKLIKRRIISRYLHHYYKTMSSTTKDMTNESHNPHTSLQSQSYSHLGQEFQSGLIVTLPTPRMISTLLSLLQDAEPLNPIYEKVSVIIRSLLSSLPMETCRGPYYYFQLNSTLIYLIQQIIDNSPCHYNAFISKCSTDVINFPTPTCFSNYSSNNDDKMMIHNLESYQWCNIHSYTKFSDDTISLLNRLGFFQNSLTASQLYQHLSKLSVTAICRYNPDQHLVMSIKLDQDDDHFGTSSPLIQDKDDDLDNAAAADGEVVDSSPADLLYESEEARDIRESIQIQSLTELSHRCLFVLKILMEHNLAEQFNVPVDATALPKYYEFIRHPLCFNDIRFHLTAGSYQDNLVQFYRDILLVLQNALAFNAETTAIAQASLKLSIVFERLFYEYVLNIEYNPLNKSESCLICRIVEEDDEDGNLILCDRCDGYYHLKCLLPPPHIGANVEWYCPACVEERDISSIHPLKNTIVKNPDQTHDDFGRVVGIVRREARKPSLRTTNDTYFVDNHDDIDYYLEYHIVFGYQLTDFNSPHHLNIIGRGSQKTTIWLVEDVLKYYYGSYSYRHADNGTPSFIKLSLPPNLPEGYTYQQYDAVSALSQGYSGWFQFQPSLPPCLDMWHSKAVHSNHINNDRLDFVGKSIFPLLSRGCDCEMMSEDWINLLLAISYKTMTLPIFVDKGNATNELSSADYFQVLSNFEKNIAPSLNDYKTYFNVEIGESLILIGDLESQSQSQISTSVEPLVQVEENDNDSETGSIETESHAISTSLVESDVDDATSRGVTPAPDASANDANDNDDDDLFTTDEINQLSQTTAAATATTTATQTPNPEEIQKKNSKFQQKAYDDALFCLKLLIQSDQQLALFESVTLEEDQTILGESPSGHNSHLLSHFLPGGYLHPVVKFLIPKFDEEYENLIWLTTFCEQIQKYFFQFIKYRQHRAHEKRCVWCNFTEFELCSPLINGSTYSEWELIKHENKNKDDNSVDENNSMILVHQYCDEYMNTRREKIFAKRQQLYDSMNEYASADPVVLADTLCGLSRGRVISIGSDRFNNTFYVFPGSHALFCYHSEFLREELVNDNTLQQQQGGIYWRVYNSFKDIGEVFLQLNSQIYCEKSLKFILQALYPEATKLATSLSSSSSTPLSSSAIHSIRPRSLDLVTYLRQSQPEFNFMKNDQWKRDEAIVISEEDEIDESIEDSDVETHDDTDMEIVVEGDGENHTNNSNKESQSNNDESGDDVEIEWDESNDVTTKPMKTRKSQITSQQTSLLSRRNESEKKSQVVGNALSDSDSHYQSGGKVVVRRGERYYEGKIITSRITKNISEESVYKIRYLGWGREYDCWIPEKSLIPWNNSSKELILNNHKKELQENQNKIFLNAVHEDKNNEDDEEEEEPEQEHNDDEREEERESILSHENFKSSSLSSSSIENIPAVLQTLQACQFLHTSNRYNSQFHFSTSHHEPILPNLKYYDENNHLNELVILKIALLMIQSALPRGSLDDHEEKWKKEPLNGLDNTSFHLAWRHSVINASSSCHLMECQLMLEYGIKSAWYKALPLKYLNCLSSRSHCLRYSNYSHLAMRIWCLDAAIRYDKIVIDASPNSLTHTSTAVSKGNSQKNSSGGGGGGGATSKSKKKSSNSTNKSKSKKR